METNPLLIDLILEKVVRYFQHSITDLKNLRLVCKTWEKEVIKIIRCKTEIDINHLIYPQQQSRILQGKNLNNGGEELFEDPGFDYNYNAPFKKTRLNGCCTVLKDPNLIRWFQLHGSTIKSLRFFSTLACYHHTRFLECVLKLWCRNLKSLILEGVYSLNSINLYSRFDKSPFLCELKEVIVITETDTLHQTEDDCEEDLELTYLNFCNKTEIINFKRPSRYLIKYEALCTWVMLAFTRDPDNSTEISTRIAKMDSELGTDGGIFAQILQYNSIERIVLKKISKRDFSLNTLFRKPKTISTLKTLEVENFQLYPFEVNMECLKCLKLHLTKICIGSLMTNMASGISAILTSYKDTLQHLEFSGEIVLWDLELEEEEEFINIDIPFLPNVTTFINGNIFCTRIGGLDFVKNLPKLETCSLTNAISHSSIFPLTPVQVFQLLFQLASFDENEPHVALNELQLDGRISFTRHLEMLRKWFPQLSKVNLTLEGADVFVEFLQIMKESELEDITLSFYSSDNEWCNAGIANNMVHMKKLKFLHLIHLTDHPLVISARTCFNGFAQAPLLMSIKLENFGMFVDEIDLIRGSLSRIGSVKFSNCILQHRPAQVEFSVGRVDLPYLL